MDNFYLIDYLKEVGYINKELFELLKHDLDMRIYTYGNNLKHSTENTKENIIYSTKMQFRSLLEDLIFKFSKPYEIKENTVISNAYFGFTQEIENLGYSTYLAPWSWRKLNSVKSDIFYDKELFYKTKKIKKALNNFTFSELIEKEFLEEIYDLKDVFTRFFRHKNILSYFAPFDLPFFERMLISVFRELNKPTFIYTHGISGVYSNVDDNSTDYLIVFGNKSKQDYINIGINKNKIFVAGHPFYKEDVSSIDLKFTLDNILVLSKAATSFPYSIEGKGIFSDRGRSILYLYSIQNILKKFNVKSVRFRPHPSENVEWYMKFIDKDFFIPDTDTLKNSINNSTLLIGPNSTVFIESLYYGINYLIYEPIIDGKDILNWELLSPFDGSDKRIIIANSEEDLETIIKDRVKPNMSFYNDYIQTPFDISFIKELL